MPGREHWGAYGVVRGSFDAPSRFSPPSGRAGTGAGSPTCRPHAGVLTAAPLVVGLTYPRRLRGRRLGDGGPAAAPDLEVERVPPSRAAPPRPGFRRCLHWAVRVRPSPSARPPVAAGEQGYLVSTSFEAFRHRQGAQRRGVGAQLLGGSLPGTGRRRGRARGKKKKRGCGPSPLSRGPSGGRLGCLGRRG